MIPLFAFFVLFLYYWVEKLPQSDPNLLFLATVLYVAPPFVMLRSFKRRRERERRAWEERLRGAPSPEAEIATGGSGQDE